MRQTCERRGNKNKGVKEGWGGRTQRASRTIQQQKREHMLRAYAFLLPPGCYMWSSSSELLGGHETLKETKQK